MRALRAFSVADLPRKRGGVGIAVAALVLGAVIVASLLTGSGKSGLTSGLEHASSNSGLWIGNLTKSLPLGYAFVAGMAAAVNPCGFAMLPAYLGFYLNDSTGCGAGQSRRSTESLVRAAWVSMVMSAGFVLLFGAAGLLLSVATAAVSGYLPWVGLAMGVVLIVAAGWMLGGGMIFTDLGERLAARVGTGARQANSRGYLAYGVAYGAASLSCTLPIFLTVVGSAVAVGGFLGSLGQFVLYALGMGFVITVLTLGTALFKTAVIARTRSLLRFVQPASAVLLLGAGAYLVYYWLTLGGLLAQII